MFRGSRRIFPAKFCARIRGGCGYVNCCGQLARGAPAAAARTAWAPTGFHRNSVSRARVDPLLLVPPIRSSCTACRELVQELQSESGTGIIDLLVPLCFRSSCRDAPRCITNFESGALAVTDLKGHGFKESTMTSHLHYVAVALALVAGAETANAQTVITREVTTEPVETIIQRGPAGTVITRRPLEMTVPRAPVTLRSTTVVDPDETIATSVEPEETITTTRETVGVSSRVAPAVRRHATRTVAARSAPPRAAVSKQRVSKSRTQRIHATTVPRAAPAVAARATTAVQPVSAPILTPAQRRVVYRTV